MILCLSRNLLRDYRRGRRADGRVRQRTSL